MSNATATPKKNQTPKPAAKPKEIPASRATRRHEVVFTPTQERIADSVADMLVHGSPADLNLWLLVRATISHDWRLKFGDGLSTEEMEKSAAQAVDRDARRLLESLIQSRIERTDLTERQAQPAEGIMQRVREAARSQCAGELQQFLETGNPEDIRLMIEIMQNYDSVHASFVGDTTNIEVGLASAFYDAIKYGSANYIRVPQELMDDVKAYVEALRKTLARTLK